MFDALRPEIAWLFPVLLLLWSAAYTFGMRVGAPNQDYSRRLLPKARLVMIGIHLAMGLLWLLGTALGTPAAAYGGWVMGALIFDALGDLALGGLLPFAGRKSEVVGLALFAVGHVLYIIAILALRGALGISGFPWMAVAISTAFGALLWFAFVSSPQRGMLNNASLPYALLWRSLPNGSGWRSCPAQCGLWRWACCSPRPIYCWPST
jgi:hypothetical protein